MLSPQAEGVADIAARRRASPGDRPAGRAPGPPRTGLTETVVTAVVRVAIRAGTRGCVTARVDDIGGRPAVVVEIDPTDPQGRADAPTTARRSPIAAHIALGRADPPRRLHRARAAPTSSRASPRSTAGGWRPRALADCSGVVPVDHRRDGPGGVRAGAAARPGRPRRDDRRRLRVRQRPDDGRRVHRRAHRHRRARRRRTSTPATPARRRSSSPTVDAAVERWSSCCSPTCPRTPTRQPPRWPTDDPADRPTPEAGDLMPDVVDRQLRRARRRSAAIVDDGELLELRAPLGAQPRHRARHDRRPPVGIVANQPHRPRRHARHPRLAEGRPVRRRSATRSTCRSSRSSTRPASTRARTSSGGG